MAGKMLNGADISVFLSKIQEANCFGHQSDSIELQKQINDWLETQLTSDASLFSEAVADAVEAIALYQPKRAYKRLVATFDSNFKLKKADYENRNYHSILSALEDLAATPDYFEFAANQLLKCAQFEVKLGVYHGTYKALHHLKALFYNTCARTKVPLKARLNYLSSCVQDADSSNDYYRLYVLMKILGVAANVFDTGEHNYQEDPDFDAYIDGSIAILIRYAGIQDENGLCSTAEEELNHLLEITIDEPQIMGATDIPYIIFKFFIEYNRTWDVDPFCHLEKLEERISDLKQDKKQDKEYITLLERRKAQLISLVADREFIAEDFKLYKGAKKEEKMCEIGVIVDPLTGLDLHARLSLAERLIFSGTSRLSDIERGWPKCTYLIASFGMVVSDRPHEAGGDHRRVFKSIPIKIPNVVISGRQHRAGGHAEEAFFESLLEEENINYFLTEFKKQFHIDAANHKIYAVVFDLHGTYDMCLSCSKKGYNFQEQFREKLIKSLEEQKMKSLKKWPSQLPVIIRYSADLKYHYPNDPDDKKKGTLMLVEKKGAAYDLGCSSEADFNSDRDINQFGANLLLHGKKNWHLLWSPKQRQKHQNKPLNLESWSAFASDREFNHLSDEKKQMNYTRLGQVDTTVKTAKKKMGKLVI